MPPINISCLLLWYYLHKNDVSGINAVPDSSADLAAALDDNMTTLISFPATTTRQISFNHKADMVHDVIPIIVNITMQGLTKCQTSGLTIITHPTRKEKCAEINFCQFTDDDVVDSKCQMVCQCPDVKCQLQFIVVQLQYTPAWNLVDIRLN